MPEMDIAAYSSVVRVGGGCDGEIEERTSFEFAKVDDGTHTSEQLQFGFQGGDMHRPCTSAVVFHLDLVYCT